MFLKCDGGGCEGPHRLRRYDGDVRRIFLTKIGGGKRRKS